MKTRLIEVTIDVAKKVAMIDSFIHFILKKRIIIQMVVTTTPAKKPTPNPIKNIIVQPSQSKQSFANLRYLPLHGSQNCRWCVA
jgi:hypothetical protein